MKRCTMYTGQRKMRGYTRETAGGFERGSRKHEKSWVSICCGLVRAHTRDKLSVCCAQLYRSDLTCQSFCIVLIYINLYSHTC